VTFESIVRSGGVQEAVRSGPLGPYMDGFVDAAAALGYTRRSFYDVVLGASQFARFLAASGVTDIRQVRDHHVKSFVATRPVSRCGNGYSTRSSRANRGARKILRYLRANGVVPPEPKDSAYGWILDEWMVFLRRHRGLALNSVALYRRVVEAFLEDLGEEAMPGSFAALSPTRVRDYLERKAPQFARITRKNLVVTLRSFLRFAFSVGHLQRDVATAIERVPCFALDRLPRGPKWEDLQKLLATVDRDTKSGRRDFAILLMLVTYGVRAGQLAGLRLEDVRWRDSQIIFQPAKLGRQIVVPLTAAVGGALLQYIRRDRRVSPARQVFLTFTAPFQPLAASSLYNIVSRAFRLSGIATPHRGSHAIRHAWATRAFARGQSLKIVADLLGHRSLESTRIYTKVDYTQLQSVGLCWPEEARP
jgi:integrase/recombinase XerD